MRTKEASRTVTATSPAAASTVVHTELFKGSVFSNTDLLVIDAALTAGTGGTLDVYLQRKLGSDSWADWLHFPQLTAATSARYAFTINGQGTSITAVGRGTDASPGVALAVNTSTNVVPGGDVRIVFVAGVGTSLGASNVITITPYTVRY